MAERRPFDEVFPGFTCPGELKELFSQVLVTEAILVKSAKVLKLHIESKILIEKQDIYAVEDSLSDFVFQGSMRVKIIEHYTLSNQYNISRLTQVYKDSLLFELRTESSILYRLVKNAEWYIDEPVITLTLDDTFLAKTRSTEIKRYLESVYRERFGYTIQVGFDYTEEQKDSIRRANEHKLTLEVNQIVTQAEQNERELAAAENTGNPENAAGRAKGADATKKKGNPADSAREKTPVPDNRFGARENAGRRTPYGRNKASDPEVIYGRNVEGEEVGITEITEGLGEIVIRGQVFEMEERELRNEKLLITFAVTDFHDSVSGKIFVTKEEWAVLKEEFKVKQFYKVKGTPAYDTYVREITMNNIAGIKPIPDYTAKRQDNALEKRVELHMHTVYSDNDSVVDVGKIISRAKEWGHPAIAITDHGVAQAFPVANHCLKKDDPFKIIYGVEGYFVDDLKDFVLNSKGQSLDDHYVVFDLETTGLSPKFCKIIEIGAVKIEQGEITDTFSVFVNPQMPIPYNITKLTSITDDMVLEADTIETVLPAFLEFVGDSVLVAHNAGFDVSFIRKFAKDMGRKIDNSVVDTMTLAHILCPELGKFTLDRICKHLGIKLENHHRAVDDAAATAEMFKRFIPMLKEKKVYTLDDLDIFGETSPDAIKKSRRYHGIILAKNEIGRVNLNRLISASHVEYFHMRPIMPKSLINKYREGLILGSACEAGELFRALVNGAEEEEIDRIVRFYDYLEIQPIGNNAFMKEADGYPDVNTDEDLQDLNRSIVKLGETYNKPVVATCDVHFLDPEDKLYRAVLMASKGFKDAENQPPLFFRTTEEMLKEFEYLGSDKAKEIVVDNTVLISNMIEKISPVSPDKCPPVIEDSDNTLRSICYDKAHEIYGPNLPKQVTDRLEKELTSIIGNGYAVMYIIAQKLVWDSNDHGYLVGSRGSVGSSFVATMAGITEVNPLSAHYICPHCYYVDFESEQVKSYSGSSGCDMPDMACPKCGTMMNKEGHDIPFETFLGFYGDKEPDIDLNFSGEYQASAHAYTEKLFGKGHAFRAGTIGTIAQKTAEQLVYKYYQEREIVKRRCELSRVASGCVGVKRTTGQHPGGMVVVPSDREIYEFTAIQKPANDTKTNIITTHFEYHSIDANLLKLDILGHDDPTIIRRLEDLTGIDAKTIALDDAQVMSIFHDPSALGIKPEDIGGTSTGSLGVPEFGTDFVIQMLVDTKPKNFSDLVRISGLSHGTDVWLGNAQTLIEEGKTELSGAICCRDDIMVYLIHMGLEPGLAFKIMESVRKGKGLQPDMEEEMLKHNVPDWYIWSCKKIKYMFPKAHAAAYVMMAWRIAYFKVNYPLAYYTAYFSIRAKAFNYETMCRGKDNLDHYMKEIMDKPKDRRTGAEEDALRDMRLVQEMYARGYEFMPIDIYRADDVNCQIIDGKIMPSFNSVEGVAGKAAAQIKEAAKQGPFISKEDLRIRAKIGKSTIEKMTNLGLLDGMPESSQLSIFDL
ncbi:MAG: PolC-type DNA polymerase III [Bacteroidales bacterium]|nr:PolC-type DNA polymerase III [Clostridium sp.]MCM1202784.1 PolC-type DNA polymerase III [Bacteroidales bacterium]